MARFAAIVFGLVTGLAWTAPAAAFEDKVAVGAGAGYAAWPGLDAVHGAAFDVQAGFGFTQAVQARAGATYALHPSAVAALHAASVRVEALYMIDVLDIVPFAGIGASGFAVARGDALELEPAAHVLAGAAYWLSFDWLLQLDVRASLLPGELDRDPVYLSAVLSAVVTLDP